MFTYDLNNEYLTNSHNLLFKKKKSICLITMFGAFKIHNKNKPNNNVKST